MIKLCVCVLISNFMQKVRDSFTRRQRLNVCFECQGILISILFFLILIGHVLCRLINILEGVFTAIAEIYNYLEDFSH